MTKKIYIIVDAEIICEQKSTKSLNFATKRCDFVRFNDKNLLFTSKLWNFVILQLKVLLQKIEKKDIL